MSPPRKPRKQKEQPPEGITKITVNGFKSLAEETSIEIRPLTILAGATSSGKSSIMQPLLLLKQTLEATYDPGPLLIHGPHVRFTQVEQMLSRRTSGPRKRSLEVAFVVEGGEALAVSFTHDAPGGLEVTRMTTTEDDSVFELRPGYSGEGLRELPGMEFLERLRAQEFGVRRDRCFLCLYRTQEPDGSDPMDLFTEPFRVRIREAIHVPGLRDNPSRTYQSAAFGPQFPGTFEAYTASVLLHWQGKDKDRLALLTEDLRSLGLTSAVQAKRLNDAQLELLVGRLPGTPRGHDADLVNIADVGIGVSQVLPVLAALRVAEAGRLVYIEQPEIHLHPRAQVALTQLLVDAANRGVRVVAETHSSLLLLALQTLIAKGRIAPDNVAMHWFERRDDGVTEVTTADVDETGAFGTWPQDFAEIELHAEDEYLTAVEQFGESV